MLFLFKKKKKHACSVYFHNLHSPVIDGSPYLNTLSLSPTHTNAHTLLCPICWFSWLVVGSLYLLHIILLKIKAILLPPPIPPPSLPLSNANLFPCWTTMQMRCKCSEAWWIAMRLQRAPEQPENALWFTCLPVNQTGDWARGSRCAYASVSFRL